MRKILKQLLAPLILYVLGGVAVAQSPYTSQTFSPATVMTATNQTSASIALGNCGQAGAGTATTATAWSAGTVTLIGSALTTATFGVLGSSDCGVTYSPIAINAVGTPATIATTATVTASGVYQINLVGLTNVEFVTSGTFTATNISLLLTAAPVGTLGRTGVASPANLANLINSSAGIPPCVGIVNDACVYGSGAGKMSGTNCATAVCTNATPTNNYTNFQACASTPAQYSLPTTNQNACGYIGISQTVVQTVSNNLLIGGAGSYANNSPLPGDTVIMPLFTNSSLASGNYVSGLSGTGATGATCLLTFSNGATATEAMTSPNTFSTSATPDLVVLNPGTNTLTSAPTTATVSSNPPATATNCAGAPVVLTTLLYTDVMQQNGAYAATPGRIVSTGIQNVSFTSPTEFPGIAYDLTGPLWLPNNYYGDYPIIGVPGQPVAFKNMQQWWVANRFDIGTANAKGYAGSGIPITSVTGTGPGTLTFPNTGQNGLAAGDLVHLSGFTGGASHLNGLTVPVLAAGLTGSTFEATATVTTTGSSTGVAGPSAAKVMGGGTPDWRDLEIAGSCAIQGGSTQIGASLLAISSGVGHHVKQNDTTYCPYPYWWNGAAGEETVGDGELRSTTLMGQAAVVMKDQGSAGAPLNTTGPDIQMTGSGDLTIIEASPFQTPSVSTVIPPWLGKTVTTSTTGGTLPNTTQYFYTIQAGNISGVTVQSSEQTVTTGTGSNSNTIPVPFNVGSGFEFYNVCRSTTSGAEALLTTIYNPSSVNTTFVDTGALTPGSACATVATMANSRVGMQNHDRFTYIGAMPDGSSTNGYGTNNLWTVPYNYDNEYSSGSNDCQKITSGDTLTAGPYMRGRCFQRIQLYGTADESPRWWGRNAAGSFIQTLDLMNYTGTGAVILSTSPTVTNLTDTGNTALNQLTVNSCTGCTAGAGNGFMTGRIEEIVVGTTGAVFSSIGASSPTIMNSSAAANEIPTANTPMMIQSTSAATSGYSAGWSGGASYWAARYPLDTFGIAYSVTADYSANSLEWFGWVRNDCAVTTMAASATPSCNYAAIRWSAGTDTYYECVTDTASGSPTVTAIGTKAPSTYGATTLIPMSISWGGGGITCTVGGTSVTNSTKVPNTAHVFNFIVQNSYPGGGTTHLWSNGWKGIAQNGSW